MVSYFQTWDVDGNTCIHLGGISDMAICGLDLFGDDLIHAKDPIELTEDADITCPQCLQTLHTAKLYFEIQQLKKEAKNAG